MKLGIYGFGEIGKLVARKAIERGYEIVGAVDIDESMIGRDIGELIGLNEDYGVEVSREPSSVGEADVVIHATGSYLDKVYDQLTGLIDMGIDTVSTCETLAYPFYRYPVLARKLDAYARKRYVTLIGTGINPGFVMDTLVVTIASSLSRVEKVRAIRSLDAGSRRSQFRRKIGVGEKPEVVRKKIERGELTGHVGYAESVYLIAEASGLHLSRVEERQEPVIAEEDVESSGVRVVKGLNKGIKGYGIGYVDGREAIRLELHAYVGAENYEEITVEGDGQRIVWRSTGTHGDTGTVAILLNIAEKISDYGPGLLTMADLIPFKPFFKP